MKNQHSAEGKGPPTPFWAWTFCFFCFLPANSVLSYSNWPLLWKLETAFFFLVLPFVFLVVGKVPVPAPPKDTDNLPLRLWLGLIFLALVPRLWRLAALSSWPVADEGMFGYFATLSEKRWDWSLIHSPANNPSPYGWILSVFFRLIPDSLTALWLVPSLLGWGCLWVLPFLNRKIIPLPAAFATGLWMAFGFWPLYLARFSHQSVLLVFWECLVLAVLLACLDSPPEGPLLAARWVGLAVLTGLGFYTYLAWPMVALMVFLAFLFGPSNPPGRKWFLAFQFGFWILLPAVPLVLALQKDYHFYFQHLWISGTSGRLWNRLTLTWGYLKAILWGLDPPSPFGYGPLWGGLMNPAEDSLFLLGLASLLKPPFQARKTWVLASFAVFFIPAFLTNSFEMMRLVALIPLLAYVSALGTVRLLSILPSSKVFWGLVLVLGLSFCLDSRHLFRVYPDFLRSNPGYYGMHKSIEYQEAYALLRDSSQKEGPGLILLNAVPDPFDQTLFVATYPFNASENPALVPSQARWAAIVANVHEQPYLQKLFPRGSCAWLSEGLGKPDGGLLLERVPVDSANKELLLRWTRADQALDELTRQVMDLGVDPDQTQMLETLGKAYPLFKDDRLSESRYWRLWAIHEAAAGRWEEAITGEKKAMGLGYPMAHLQNELGCLLLKVGRLAESKATLRETLKLKPNYTDAIVNLQNLAPVGKTQR